MTARRRRVTHMDWCGPVAWGTPTHRPTPPIIEPLPHPLPQCEPATPPLAQPGDDWDTRKTGQNRHLNPNSNHHQNLIPATASGFGVMWNEIRR
jgi:hypothetical protein